MIVNSLLKGIFMFLFVGFIILKKVLEFLIWIKDLVVIRFNEDNWLRGFNNLILFGFLWLILIIIIVLVCFGIVYDLVDFV